MNRARRQRKGKISWVTSTVTVALVGMAGVAGTVSLQTKDSKKGVLTNYSGLTSGDDLQSESPWRDLSAESIAAAPTQSPLPVPEPSGGSAPQPSPSFSVAPNEASEVRAPEAPKKKKATAPQYQNLGSKERTAEEQAGENTGLSVGSQPIVDPSWIEVHFATDRERIDPKSLLLWARILLPALLGLIISFVMLVGLLKSLEKWVWGLGLTLSLCLTFLFTHHASIFGQQALRLISQDGFLFGSRRYESPGTYPLQLGISYVSLPANHQKGHVERPQLYEFREDPKKHVVLQRIEIEDERQFFSHLKTKVDQGRSNAAFVFIHGYNVQFDDALRRTAQIKKDLDFDGPAILYSWPSHGNVLSYQRDGDNAAWTIAHLEQFLKDVKARTGVRDLHVIAHSMGNRALVGALGQLANDPSIVQPIVSQLVMAAPDVDVSEFKMLYAEAVDTCSRQATLYTSANDRALIASMKIHGYPRLGLSLAEPHQFAGVDSIEVSPIDPSLLGHSYYGSHPLLIRDLKAIIELAEPPNHRGWLIPIAEAPPKTAWRFSPRFAAEAALQR